MSDAPATLKQRRYFYALSGIAAALEKEYTAGELVKMIRDWEERKKYLRRQKGAVNGSSRAGEKATGI